MPKPQTPHVFTTRVYLYALPHEEHPFWSVGWLDPGAYFCDVTPEQSAEYQRWWDTCDVIDASRVRMTGWPSLIAETSEVAELMGAPAPVAAKIQPQFAGKIGVGWVHRGHVWIAIGMDVSSHREWRVGVARVETDTRTGTRRISREG